MHAEKLIPLVLLVLGSGCADRTVASVPSDQGRVEVKDIPANPRRDLDILFLIDDSGSMKEEQDSLKANFHRFIEVLQSLDGGLPNVHIGVTSSDLGTSALDGTANPVGGCSGQGKAGALRRVPGGGPAYLEDVDDGNGGRRRNYAGALADVFAQIADVGVAGCGIEQHLEAVKRALDHNPTNANFLRDNAYLAVILIADEDDCSLAQKSLFDGSPTDPTYGDKVNFRCTTQGVECDTPSADFETTLGPREDCHPKYDTTQLAQLDRYVGFLKGLKADPLDVIVAGVIGDPGPFEIIKKNNLPVLKQSCIYEGPSGTQFAYPGIRTADFLGQFAERNTHSTICTSDLSAALVQVAALLKRVVADPCFDRQLLDADPTTDGAQYDCSVTEVRHRANTADEELRVIGQCDAARSRLPCWHIEEDADHCSYTQTNPHLKLVVDRGSEIPAADVHVKVSCVTTSPSGGVQ
jgi:hypothetical protein